MLFVVLNDGEDGGEGTPFNLTRSSIQIEPFNERDWRDHSLSPLLSILKRGNDN